MLRKSGDTSTDSIKSGVWPRTSRFPITVELKGGLGNQLFQLSAAIVASRRTNRSFRLDPLSLNLSTLVGVRRRRLSIEELLHPHELHSLASAWYVRLASRGTGFLREAGPLDDALSRITPTTRRMVGYFQRAEVAEEASTQLFRRFECSVFADLILRSKPEPRIAVHVRRGDYLTARSQSYHGLTSRRFFLDGVKHAASITGINRVLIVSDDPVGACALLAESLSREGFTLTPEHAKSDWGDLGMLANSSAVVMSNSSFSWWGAYIAFKRHGALAVAPVPWYAKSNNVESVLFPTSWHTIARNHQVESNEI